jgi:hypothetical protein
MCSVGPVGASRTFFSAPLRDVNIPARTYEEGLKIMRALSARDPHNVEWQRDLEVSLIKCCDTLRVQNDLAGSADACREGLAIARSLVALDPGNCGWQRDLQWILLKFGDVLAAAGQPVEAVQACHDSLAIARTLAAQDESTASQLEVVRALCQLASQNETPQQHLAEAMAILRRSEAQGRLGPEQCPSAPATLRAYKAG